MQLSASSFFLDPAAGPVAAATPLSGTPGELATAASADGFGALLTAQSKPAAGSNSAPTAGSSSGSLLASAWVGAALVIPAATCPDAGALPELSPTPLAESALATAETIAPAPSLTDPVETRGQESASSSRGTGSLPSAQVPDSANAAGLSTVPAKRAQTAEATTAMAANSSKPSSVNANGKGASRVATPTAAAGGQDSPVRSARASNAREEASAAGGPAWAGTVHVSSATPPMAYAVPGSSTLSVVGNDLASQEVAPSAASAPDPTAISASTAEPLAGHTGATIPLCGSRVTAQSGVTAKPGDPSYSSRSRRNLGESATGTRTSPSLSVPATTRASDRVTLTPAAVASPVIAAAAGTGVQVDASTIATPDRPVARPAVSAALQPASPHPIALGAAGPGASVSTEVGSAPTSAAVLDSPSDLRGGEMSPSLHQQLGSSLDEAPAISRDGVDASVDLIGPERTAAMNRAGVAARIDEGTELAASTPELLVARDASGPASGAVSGNSSSPIAKTADQGSAPAAAAARDSRSQPPSDSQPAFAAAKLEPPPFSPRAVTVSASLDTEAHAATATPTENLTQSRSASANGDAAIADYPAGGLEKAAAQVVRAPARWDSAVEGMNRPEKFAGGGAEPEASPIAREESRLKKSPAASQQHVTNHSESVGINAAKPESLMPAFAHPTPPPFAEHDEMSFATVPLTFDSLVDQAGETSSGELSSSARRAVDSAMAVADHFARGSQRSVNLQFSVSGVDLAVRVEMRQDGVHTTFRTDSPELRAALAQEWNSVIATQAADRPQRLSEAVFTSSATGGSTSGDEGTSHHRESGARHSQWETAATFAPPALARAEPDAPAVMGSVASAPTARGTSRHLHTFA